MDALERAASIAALRRGGSPAVTGALRVLGRGSAGAGLRRVTMSAFEAGVLVGGTAGVLVSMTVFRTMRKLEKRAERRAERAEKRAEKEERRRAEGKRNLPFLRKRTPDETETTDEADGASAAE